MKKKERKKKERIRHYRSNADMKWKSYIQSIALSAARKTASLYRARQHFSSESILHIYKSTIRPCLEYCCHIWGGAPYVHLELLDRIQRRISNIIGPDLSAKLQSLAHRRDVASLCLFYKYFHGLCSDELFTMVPSLYRFKRNTRLAARSHQFTVKLARCNRGFYANSFFSRTSRLWNSLPAFCFPDGYNLQRFKCNVNRYMFSS